MSLWYDIKNKVYSSGPMDNWYIKYMQNCCNALAENITSIFKNHTSGLVDRHKCEDIDFDDTNLRDAFDNAVTERNEALSLKVDKEDGKQLSSNDFTDSYKTSIEKSAGRVMDGNDFFNISRLPDGTPSLSPTNALCGPGSEIFNDYSYNQARGRCSHAEGRWTSAEGHVSHAEGMYTKAGGLCSHVEGENTIASAPYQHIQGILNIEDTAGKYMHIVGNGYYNIDENSNEIPVRRNAHTLDWKGNAWYAGDIICGNKKTGLQAQITDLYNLRPTVLNEVSDVLSLNTIYDLGQCETLTLNIPDGNVGDWIKVDFISGETPTTLSLVTDKISDYSITPDANTAYSLIFDWGKITADTYGWRFSYSEYTKAVD